MKKNAISKIRVLIWTGFLTVLCAGQSFGSAPSDLGLVELKRAAVNVTCSHCNKSQAELEKAAGITEADAMSFGEKLTQLLRLEYGDMLKKMGEKAFKKVIIERINRGDEGFIGYLRAMYGDKVAAQFPAFLTAEEEADKILNLIKDPVETEDEFNPLDLDNDGGVGFSSSNVQNTAIDTTSGRTTTTTTQVEDGGGGAF